MDHGSEGCELNDLAKAASHSQAGREFTNFVGFLALSSLYILKEYAMCIIVPGEDNIDLSPVPWAAHTPQLNQRQFPSACIRSFKRCGNMTRY